MKIFVSVQVLTVTAAVIAGCIIKSSVPDAGIADIRTYDDIQHLKFDCITTADMVENDPISSFGSTGRAFDSTYNEAMFVCTAQDSFTFANGVFRQEITIDKQISGNCPEVGETIGLTVDGGIWRLPKNQYRYNEHLSSDIPDTQPLTILYLGGGNFMKPGHRYLVSCITKQLGSKTYYGTPYGKLCWLDLADDPGELFYDSDEARNKAQARKKKVLIKYGVGE